MIELWTLLPAGLSEPAEAVPEASGALRPRDSNDSGRLALTARPSG